MHASRQAAPITRSCEVLHFFFVTPQLTPCCVGEDCQERRKAQGFVDGRTSDNPFPGVAVRGNESHFDCGIRNSCAAEMFQQVLEREEGISDVGFRPVQKYAAISRSNDIPWVQVEV